MSLYSGLDLKLYPGVLEDQLQGEFGMVARYMRRRARVHVARAKADVGVRTGALQRSIGFTESRIPGGRQVVIYARKSYATLHHEGTRPHLIRASGNQRLVFPTSQGVRSARVVRHPGTRANKFLSRHLRSVWRG